MGHLAAFLIGTLIALWARDGWVRGVGALLGLASFLWWNFSVGQFEERGLLATSFWPALGLSTLLIVALVAGELALFREAIVRRKSIRWLSVVSTGAGAAGQQVLLLSFVYWLLAGAVGSLLGGLATAAIFALLHLPNWFLVQLTLIGAVPAIVVYELYPNVWAVGVGHMLASVALRSYLSDELIGKWKVGRSYLEDRK